MTQGCDVVMTDGPCHQLAVGFFNGRGSLHILFVDPQATPLSFTHTFGFMIMASIIKAHIVVWQRMNCK